MIVKAYLIATTGHHQRIKSKEEINDNHKSVPGDQFMSPPI